MRLASLNIAIESVTPIWSAKNPLTAAMAPNRATTAAAIPMVTISKDSRSKRAKTNEDGAPILRNTKTSLLLSLIEARSMAFNPKMDEMNLGSGNRARNETKIKGVLDYKSGKRM